MDKYKSTIITQKDNNLLATGHVIKTSSDIREAIDKNLPRIGEHIKTEDVFQGFDRDLQYLLGETRRWKNIEEGSFSFSSSKYIKDPFTFNLHAFTIFGYLRDIMNVYFGKRYFSPGYPRATISYSGNDKKSKKKLMNQYGDDFEQIINIFKDTHLGDKNISTKELCLNTREIREIIENMYNSYDEHTHHIARDFEVDFREIYSKIKSLDSAGNKSQHIFRDDIINHLKHFQHKYVIEHGDDDYLSKLKKTVASQRYGEITWTDEEKSIVSGYIDRVRLDELIGLFQEKQYQKNDFNIHIAYMLIKKRYDELFPISSFQIL